MKSFFKKLAFVMALAMVVSLVAPAGDAFAATTGIAIQGTDTIVTEYTFEKADATFDFCFKGAPSDWKKTYEWTSSNEDVATVDKAGVVTAKAPGTATITITAGADKSYVETVKITVKEQVEEMTPVQKTAFKVEVKFTENHGFDATGTDADGVNTVKVYRVFSTDEMAKMANKNGLKFDEEGNGYQAYYVKNAAVTYDKDGNKVLNTWVIEGYNAFVDGAKYAVVYGENETSSTINGIKAFFTAYVGKVAKIKVSATQATVENDVEPAVPAYLSTKLYNAQDIDLTDYYKNADETDYELLTEDIDVSVSGNEVTFDEIGVATVKGSYTFYDEDLEEDVTLTDEEDVIGGKYSTYRVESIYNWTLASGYKAKWAATKTSMIAGDQDQLYVIVKDNRGNYYSNVPGIENQNYYINNVKVLEIGNGDDNTAFEQYGYELVFDSLDPDSLLVDADGAVESYKKTNSFAVVSYRRTDDEAAKLYEIGVMGIEVTAARKLKSVNYKNGTSFTVLKETEAEGTETDAYNKPAYKDDFKLYGELKVEFLNQYGKKWDSKAEDWGEVETNFTVTTTKDDFVNVAADIADDLNDYGAYKIYPSIFTGTNTTSVTFKIKESATGDSTSVTIKLEKPKYVLDEEGDETTEVFVDPTRAIMFVDGFELYRDTLKPAKLFQVSKANQKVGYFRVGTLEMEDEEHGYYVGTALSNSFVIKKDDTVATFVTGATGAALTKEDLKVGDYILVVTDPNGKVFPLKNKGGNGLAFGDDSLLGLEATADGTAFNVVAAAKKANGEMEYATAGTYRATVYKITNIVTNQTTGDTKYSTSRVSSDSFLVSKTLNSASFYHQEKTKDVEVGSFDPDDKATIIEAICDTMTFRINGENFKLENGVGYYLSNVDYWGMQYYDWAYSDDYSQDYNADGNPDVAFWGKHYQRVEIEDVDFKVQGDGNRAVINTVTFKLYTPAGGYYLNKVKVNRSVNAAE